MDALELSETRCFAMPEKGERTRTPLLERVTYAGSIKQTPVALFGIAAGLA